MSSNKPRVLYDHQIFSLQRIGGISRYFAELMMQYKKNQDVDFELACRYSDNYYLNNITKWEFVNRSLLPAGRLRKYGSYAFNLMTSINTVGRGNYDVFHPTYYSPYFLNKLGGKPFVITVHDLTQDLFPGFFKNPGRNTEMKKNVLAKADKVIAISENTKKDIINIFEVPEEKITVIYHGNSLKCESKMTIRGNLRKIEKRYVLFIGLRGGYKNFNTFVNAVSLIMRSDASLHVICAGGGPFSKEEKAALEITGVENRFSQETVNDETLIGLYSNALALVFPSLYEGFGMPILEAMDCGCPAILSNTSSMPEIGGEAALFFNPTDIASIRDSIEKVIYDEALRQLMISNGIKQAGKFSWEKTAEKTRMIYTSFL